MEDIRPKKPTWEVQRVRFERLSERAYMRLDERLEEGWEPFAVTGGPDLFTYHLRRLS